MIRNKSLKLLNNHIFQARAFSSEYTLRIPHNSLKFKQVEMEVDTTVINGDSKSIESKPISINACKLYQIRDLDVFER